MAARPLLVGLSAAARSGVLSLSIRNAPRRSFQLDAVKFAPATSSTQTAGGGMASNMPPSAAIPRQRENLIDTDHAAFLGEADSNEGHDAYRDAHGAPQPSLDAENAAFLGEADSDDGFEARRAAEGDKRENLDASQAAFLGEADSDDGFEARKAAEGDKHESMDATNAAFLGEADGDDAHEADFDVHPEKHRHKIEDTSSSGFHGERGEDDQGSPV